MAAASQSPVGVEGQLDRSAAAHRQDERIGRRHVVDTPQHHRALVEDGREGGARRIEADLVAAACGQRKPLAQLDKGAVVEPPEARAAVGVDGREAAAVSVVGHELDLGR